MKELIKTLLVLLLNGDEAVLEMWRNDNRIYFVMTTTKETSQGKKHKTGTKFVPAHIVPKEDQGNIEGFRAQWKDIMSNFEIEKVKDRNPLIAKFTTACSVPSSTGLIPFHLVGCNRQDGCCVNRAKKTVKKGDPVRFEKS